VNKRIYKRILQARYVYTLAMKVLSIMFAHIKLGFLLTLCISLMLGCSSESQKIQLTQDSVILAFGDSLTKGTGARIEESYPSNLQEILGLTVVNEGIPGEISEKGLKRLAQLLAETSPDLVILCHGGNDILKGLSTDKLENNLAQMIELIKSQGAEVILVGVPKPSIILTALPLYEKLATEYLLVSDLKSLSNLLKQPSMKSDRVHLNGNGYRELAINIASKIEVI
jgi:acyl-CoA thioesterase-1